MGILESLAGGLRQAGGALSAPVQKEVLDQDQQDEQRIQQRRVLIANQTIKAVESGAMDPAAGGAVLAKNGFGDVPVGPSADTLTRQADLARNTQYAAEAAKLSSDDLDGQAALAQKFLKPDVAARLMEVKAKRIGDAQQRLDNLEQRRVQMEQVHEERLSRLANDAQRTVETARHNAAMESLTATSNGINQELKRLGLTIQQQNADTRAAAAGSGGQLGNRESVFINRVLLSGNEAARDLENVVKLPMTASSGFFGGRGQEVGIMNAGKETLTNKMTSQEVQSYNVLATGFQRSLAAIEAAGLATTSGLSHQMEAVLFRDGDTNFTKLQKLAQTRQIVEAGLESMMSNPRVPKETKQHAEDIITKVTKAVPFTQSDLIELQKKQGVNPKMTLADVVRQRDEVQDVLKKADAIIGKPK